MRISAKCVGLSPPSSSFKRGKGDHIPPISSKKKHRAIATYQRIIDKRLKRRIFVDAQSNKFVQCVNPTYSPFKVVKFRTKIGYFNLQQNQNLSRELRMIALKQPIFIGLLERASPTYFDFLVNK